MNRPNLTKRVLFALWAVPLGWWAINSDYNLLGAVGGALYPGHILAVLLMVLAGYEYIRMLAIRFPRNGFWLIYLWLLGQVVLYFRDDAPPSGLSIYALYVLLILVAAEGAIWGERATGRWMRASLLFSGTAFLYVSGVSMLNFYQPPFQLFFVSYPAWGGMLSQLGIATVLAAVFMCDTAAYFVGSLWGKRHFSTISPHKTVEGSIAGLVAAGAIGTLGWHFFGVPTYPWIIGPIMGIIIGIFAQMGDLMVSLIKRYFQVKDSSDIIPGHGGILDRFDSLFFTAPTVVLYFWAVSTIPGWGP
jgi:phosphatidate cytidylyltransferase